MIMQSNPNGSHGSVLGPLWSIHFGVPYWMCVCLFRRTEFIDLFFWGGRKVLPSFQFPTSEFAQYCLTCPTLIGFLGAYQLSEVSRGLPRFRRNWRRSWKIWTPLRRKSCINSRTPLRPGTEHLKVRRVWFFRTFLVPVWRQGKIGRPLTSCHIVHLEALASKVADTSSEKYGDILARALLWFIDVYWL